MSKPVTIPVALIDAERIRAVNSRASEFLARFSNVHAGAYVITSQLDADMAAMDLRGLKGQLDAIELERKSITQPKNYELNVINATFAAIVEPVDDVLNFIKRALIVWQTEQRRAAAEQARRDQELAAKKQARLEEQAAAAREQGKDARADILEDRAAQVVAPPPPPPPKAEGLGSRMNYSIEITDATLVPREFCVPDEKVLNALARALKDNFKVAGVRLVKTPGMSVRAR